jgi:hypothetical protein
VKYEDGSVIQFALDNSGRSARIRDSRGYVHRIPIIGWGVVVLIDQDEDSGAETAGAEVTPILLPEGMRPITLDQYLDAFGGSWADASEDE